LTNGREERLKEQQHFYQCSDESEIPCKPSEAYMSSSVSSTGSHAYSQEELLHCSTINNRLEGKARNGERETFPKAQTQKSFQSYKDLSLLSAEQKIPPHMATGKSLVLQKGTSTKAAGLALRDGFCI
jgi:hypothetical protein